MPNVKNLRTVRQLAAESQGSFTEPALRWLIFKASENGLDRAIVRIGKRVRVDVEAFNKWLGRQGEHA